ncbi:hypothetical protein EWI07_12580 [Sporolactobacillus sp. THM7-4]|nr:hypothetical protein EWI07_12580 [Sporolactobacillus sp. THM7-4]
MDRYSKSLFEAVGGEEVLGRLVDTFYHYVKLNPEISSLFPDDLSETARKQKQFLTQFLGGPALYSIEHGHPMLRARHLRFPIGEGQASAWLSCMRKAMDEVGLNPEYREIIFDKLTKTAHHMVNQPAFENIREVNSRDTLL